MLHSKLFRLHHKSLPKRIVAKKKIAGSRTKQLLAFADVQTIIAEMKRTADEVSDLELPEGSRPMLALDRTRHRPANHQPNLVQHPSAATSTQAAAVPPQAAVPPPASSDPRLSDSTVASSQPTASPSGLDSMSPVVQSMLREALDKGRSEGRQEIQAKLDEAESEVKELRSQVDPAKLKAEYDRGFREGGKRVYDMCSLDRAKASQDRLAFQKICDEKDMAIYDQQLTMSRYQKELMARRRRIVDLEQHATKQPGQNITGQQILDAEARFNAQARELAVETSQSQLMRVDLGNWQVRWNTISADLEEWKTAFNIKASQLDAYQRQQNNSALELQESRDQAKQLAATNSELIGSWKASTKELRLKLNMLSSDFGSLERLTTKLAKVAAERSAEIKLIKALNDGNSKQAEDGKEEINALTFKNVELAKVRDNVEETVARQDKELQDLSAENDELARKLREREEEGRRATPNLDNEEQAEEIDDLPAELVPETTAANLELVRVMVERERDNTAPQNVRWEQRATATLGRMEETEQRRRQALMDELEVRDAQLYDAQQQITELNERLLTTSPIQPLQSLSAPSSSQSPPEASPSPTQPSPIPTQVPPAAAAPSPPSHPRSWSRLVTVAATNFSPRRLAIILLIFLFAFFSFHLHSASRLSATEDTNSGQVTVGVVPLPADLVVARSEAEAERRLLVQIMAMRNWERNERMFRGEEPRERKEEYRPILGLDF